MKKRIRKRHYDSTHARSLYFETNKIYQKSGTGNYAMWFCENPDCRKIQFLKDLEIHHLIPRRLSPSLTYVSSNMVLICSECHQEIENNKHKKIKTPYQYKQLIFCKHCGLPIEMKRDRIDDFCFHPGCTLPFLKSTKYKKLLIQLENQENDESR